MSTKNAVGNSLTGATGTGQFVGDTGATLSGVTLSGSTALGTPTSGNLTNCTGIPSPTGAALTKTNDTNVTITLGGTPASALLQASSLTMGWTGTLAVGRGGTGVSSVTTTPTASSFAGWDANNNLSANAIIAGYASTATAGSTTTLTVASAQQQVFTGTLAQNCKMPVVSTLTLGTFYVITNLSTGSVTAQSSGANSIQVMGSNTTLILQSNAITGTAASVWNTVAYIVNTTIGTGSAVLASSSTGSGSVVYNTSPALTTPTLSGITGGGNAASGILGEEIVANPSSASVSSGVITNLTSINVTAGDWIIYGWATCIPSGGSLSNFCSGVNTVSGTFSTNFSELPVTNAATISGNTFGLPLSVQRINITTTTTYYLIVYGVLSGGSMTWNGNLTAKRMR